MCALLDTDFDAKGFTVRVLAESYNGEYVIELAIRPDTDLETTFRAYDVDDGEMLKINGWNWDFEVLQ